MARPRLRKPKVAGKAAAQVPASSSGYTAQGLATNPSEFEQELGSGRPVQVLEVVPELASSYSRLLTYSKMQNDASVDVSVRAAQTPVLGADYFVEPASDDQEDADIAEFIEANLMGGMTAPFLMSLEDILAMYVDGYSVLEKVYENRLWAPDRAGGNGKQYTMLKELAVRPANTITDLQYDNNGHLVQLLQNAIQADGQPAEKTLKAEKVLLFTFRRKGSDLTGKSLLRTAYAHWYYKTHLYKIDAIQKERHGLGVPRAKLPAGYKAALVKTLRTLLGNLRSNEEAFMILPPGVEVDFAELKGQPVNVMESVDHHNVMILLNVMAQFLALGIESHGGGRATGGAQTDIYMKALRHVANLICDIINMYLIPELVVYNFKTNRFPKLRVRNMGETRDLQMLGSALSNVISQGGITMDRPTENWIRRVFDMPPKSATEPGIDPNAKQQTVVTLYTADGTAVQVPAGTTKPDNSQPGNDNGTAPQKGNVKANGGQGNVGKPTTAPQ